MTAPNPSQRPLRSRRSCLAVPGSSTKMLDKAQGLPADQVFLDLEDAVAPDAKESARKNVVDALANGDWGDRTRVVRVNDLTTQWTYRDVLEVVEGAGAQLLGHSLVNVVLRTTSPTVVSLAILFEVPGAILIAAIWLRQLPPAGTVPGLLVLLAGLALVVRSGARAVPVE